MEFPGDFPKIRHNRQSWSAYEVLGLKHDATEAEAKQAYHKTLKTAHPDKGGDAVAFQQIQRAYESVLSDIVARKTSNVSYRMSQLSAHASEDECSKEEEEAAPQAGSTGLASPDVLAGEAKRRGNEAFAAQRMQAAKAHYTEALTWAPSDHTIWSNRSAAHVHLEDFHSAVEDAERAVEIKPRWPK
ncbi:hypothetical protein CYMTET_30774, partial [Cymbomonas tetramitiformis]